MIRDADDARRTAPPIVPHRGGVLRRRWLIIASALLIATVWLGCSVNDSNYKMLSFFFDGVPDPAILKSATATLEQVRAAGGTIYNHKPHAEDKCGECHRGRGGMMNMTVSPRVCLKCHGGIPEQHPLMHGPVAAVACLWCHSPHESIHKHLLRDSAPTLCRQCHNLTRMGEPTSPAHVDLERNCLDCHTGHGGTARYFLRSPAKEDVGAPAEPPTTTGAP